MAAQLHSRSFCGIFHLCILCLGRGREKLPLESLGLTAEEMLQRRLRVQWALRRAAPLAGLAMQLGGSSGSGSTAEDRGHCAGPEPVECECYAPWRGPLCDRVDGSIARDYRSAIHYIVNEDDVHLAELRHSLRNLWKHFNSRYDHPVQIFHDGLTDETRASIVRTSPNRIWFHRLPEDFVPPASQLPQDLLVEDTERTVSHHTFSVGYRAQCRFRSGPLFEHPAVARLDYLMSLDTDSMFTEDVEMDPIEAMHQNKSLVLGYSHLMISNGAYMKGLWTATQPYLTYRGLKLAKLLQQNWHFLSRFLVPYVGHHTQEVMYSNLVVMTDLELLRISFFRPGSDYFRFYRYLDELGGFWEHRWGDHAVRGLGAGIVYGCGALAALEAFNKRSRPMRQRSLSWPTT
ncbi:KTR2 [Symbiodinium sp. CCMP2592]|nr:KTR2 [Symbiodinium sp. CCMP2592]